MTEAYSHSGGPSRDPGARKRTSHKNPGTRNHVEMPLNPTPLPSSPPAKMFLFVIVYKRLLSVFYLIILYEVIMRE